MSLEPKVVMKTLKQIKLEAIYERLKHFGWQRTKTAKSLEICVRSMRIHIQSMRDLKWDVPFNPIHQNHTHHIRSPEWHENHERLDKVWPQ